MNGILNVLKPPGMTSHDVVSCVRRLYGTKKVGHAGTLDPAAAGVLVLGVGTGTRFLEFVCGAPKVYRADISLGQTTDTDDAEGTVLTCEDASAVTEAAVLAALKRLTGTVRMIPPMYAAIRHEGRKLYELARAGQVVEREPREVQIYRLELIEFRPGEQATVRVDVQCSQGTYIRSLAQVLGEDLGCGGHLRFLLRTQVGAYCIQDAATLQELQAASDGGRLASYLRSGVEATETLPTIRVDDEMARRLANGLSQRRFDEVPLGRVRVLTADERLVCIAQVDAAEGGFVIRPRKVLNAEE